MCSLVLGHKLTYPFHLWSNWNSIVLKENMIRVMESMHRNFIHPNLKVFLGRHKEKLFFYTCPLLFPMPIGPRPKPIWKNIEENYPPEKTYKVFDEWTEFNLGPIHFKRSLPLRSMNRFTWCSGGWNMDKFEELRTKPVHDNRFLHADNGRTWKGGAMIQKYFNKQWTLKRSLNGSIRGWDQGSNDC